MCPTIVIDGYEVRTLDELAAIVGGRGRVSICRGYPESDRDGDFWFGCLCPVRVEHTAKRNGYVPRRDEHDSMRWHWRKHDLS